MKQETNDKMKAIMEAAMNKANIKATPTFKPATVPAPVKPVQVDPMPELPAPVLNTHTEELSSITFDSLMADLSGTSEATAQAEPIPAKIDSKLQLVDYSVASFAVIGETYPLRAKMREMGGKFNYNLKCGAGWIFPKKKLYTVRYKLGLLPQ